MRVKELYNTLFTEYPGPVGFAPAVATLFVCIVVIASVGYGGFMVGKAVFADTPTTQTGHS